ncbi:hypothetical protein TNCV_2435121 [Trichonephila clavipes]|nr:hypothetical protein TNCV_2435121 [Trichonephila clavipes]
MLCKVKVWRPGWPIYAANILSLSRIALTRRTLRGLALSSIKMNSRPHELLKRRTQGSKTSSLYLTPIKEPLSKTWRDVRASNVMPDQTIKLPPP